MTGELFEIIENELKVVSLDGHRISIRNIELKNNYENKKVVVPGKTLQEISKIVPGGVDDDVLIYLTDNHIVFEFDTTTAVSYTHLDVYKRQSQFPKETSQSQLQQLYLNS